METPALGHARAPVSAQSGRRFWKVCGSGNDFIFFDARVTPPGDLERPDVVDRICARATGVGADGVVFMQPDAAEAFRITYLNRDGSLAELCGNASLCSARVAVELGIVDPAGFRFRTDAGLITARIAGDQPEVDMEAVANLRADAGIDRTAAERRIGFATVGVPHLVVLVDDVEAIDVERRGRELRQHASLQSGANVNFVAHAGGDLWRMRTYERGVERETLACGTGSVAAAVLLESWGLSGDSTGLQTSSGRRLDVTLEHSEVGIRPSLRGEGRIVFVGELIDA